MLCWQASEKTTLLSPTLQRTTKHSRETHHDLSRPLLLTGCRKHDGEVRCVEGEGEWGKGNDWRGLDDGIQRGDWKRAEHVRDDGLRADVGEDHLTHTLFPTQHENHFAQSPARFKHVLPLPLLLTE